MSFLHDYHTYTESLEVPEIFHVWSALAALSAAAQRKIWLSVGGLLNIAPNIYVVLNAPPGIGKDTAMNLIRNMLGEFKSIKSKSDSITKEKIFQDMMEFSSVYDLGGGEHLLTVASCCLRQR